MQANAWYTPQTITDNNARAPRSTHDGAAGGAGDDLLPKKIYFKIQTPQDAPLLPRIAGLDAVSSETARSSSSWRGIIPVQLSPYW